VLTHSSATNAVEVELATTLVTMVDGSQLVVTPEQVLNHLTSFYRVETGGVCICRYRSGGFLVNFVDAAIADRVLHASWPQAVELVLIFHRWTRQACAQFDLLCFKALLAVENIPAHLWFVQTVQDIVGSSCMVFKPAPTLVQTHDLSFLMVAAWAVHPELIPREVGCVVPEPKGPSEVSVRPHFLRAEEIIHS
jgi:hypothetical protein